MTTGLHAQVTNYNIFKEDFLSQTGPSTVTSTDWAATANLSTTNATDASTVKVTAPSGASYALTASAASPTSYAKRGDFPTKSFLDTAFPSGSDYSFAVSGGTLGPETGSLDVPSETALPYPSKVPAFTNYNAVQNLNTAAVDTFRFAGFTDISGGVDSSLLFFNIFDPVTGDAVYSQNFLSASTTSVAVPAGTLKPGTAYVANLDYSNRAQASTTGFNGVTPFTGFDYNTSANFTTAAAPEPSTWWLALAGAGVLTLRAARSGRRSRRDLAR